MQVVLNRPWFSAAQASTEWLLPYTKITAQYVFAVRLGLVETSKETQVKGFKLHYHQVLYKGDGKYLIGLQFWNESDVTLERLMAQWMKWLNVYRVMTSYAAIRPATNPPPPMEADWLGSRSCMAAGPSASSWIFSFLLISSSALSHDSAILRRGLGSPFARNCWYSSSSPILPYGKLKLMINENVNDFDVDGFEHQ